MKFAIFIIITAYATAYVACVEIWKAADHYGEPITQAEYVK